MKNKKHKCLTNDPAVCALVTSMKQDKSEPTTSEMKLTLQKLEELGACEEGKQWFISKKQEDLKKVFNLLIKESKFEWANWLLTRLLPHKENVLYACYSAKLSLKYFEKQFPNDKRPRLSIEAAIRWANNPTEENKAAAKSAAESAAESAASLAAESLESLAARSASLAAESLAARSAAWAVSESAWKKILLYGISLFFKKGLCK